MFPNNYKPKRRLDLACEELDGEVVIYDQSQNKIHALNTTAAWIWRQCDAEHSLMDIINTMVKVFEVNPQQAEQDVRRTIAELSQLSLLE